MTSTADIDLGIPLVKYLMSPATKTLRVNRFLARVNPVNSQWAGRSEQEPHSHVPKQLQMAHVH